MRGYQHLMLGATAGACGGYALMMQNMDGIPFAVACMVSSLFPDIDIGTSKIGKRIGPASTIINKLFGHRGFIHTPICAAILCGILWLLTGQLDAVNGKHVVYGFAVGYFLHLLQDTCTRGGIMWFFPLKFKFRLSQIKSNSPVCIIITLAMCALCVGITIWMLSYKIMLI